MPFKMPSHLPKENPMRSIVPSGKFLALLPLLPLAFIACAGPRMVPPAEVASGTVLDSKNRKNASGLFVNEAFDLGSYRVDKVDRKSISGSGFTISNYSTNKTTTGYSYLLKGGTQEWKGACAMSKDDKSVGLGKGMSIGRTKSSLTCECKSGDNAGRLELKAGNDGEYAGSFSPAGKSYDVTAVKDFDKKYWGAEPAGYRFDGTDGARGAVETMKPGRIWYTEKMAENEREPATCVLAGLMLYVEPSEH
jgi:hypothetical protein